MNEIDYDEVDKIFREGNVYGNLLSVTFTEKLVGGTC